MASDAFSGFYNFDRNDPVINYSTIIPVSGLSSELGPTYRRGPYPLAVLTPFNQFTQNRDLPVEVPDDVQFVLPEINNWPFTGRQISSEYRSWYEELRVEFYEQWKLVGIASMIDLSVRTIHPDMSLLKAAILHWSSGDCAFFFRAGKISATFRDVAFITGLPCIGDPAPFNSRNSPQSSRPSRFQAFFDSLGKGDLSSTTFMARFRGSGLPLSVQNVGFILLFLSRFIACTKGQKITKEYPRLAERLASGRTYDLGTLFLGNFCRAMCEFQGFNSRSTPVSCGGPLWFLQFLLHAYFPRLGLPEKVESEKGVTFGLRLAPHMPKRTSFRRACEAFYDPASVSWNAYHFMPQDLRLYQTAFANQEEDWVSRRFLAKALRPRILISGLNAFPHSSCARSYPYTPANCARQQGFGQGWAVKCWFCPESAKRVYSRGMMEDAESVNARAERLDMLREFAPTFGSIRPDYRDWWTGEFLRTHTKTLDQMLADHARLLTTGGEVPGESDSESEAEDTADAEADTAAINSTARADPGPSSSSKLSFVFS